MDYETQPALQDLTEVPSNAKMYVLSEGIARGLCGSQCGQNEGKTEFAGEGVQRTEGGAGPVGKQYSPCLVLHSLGQSPTEHNPGPRLLLQSGEDK